MGGAFGGGLGGGFVGGDDEELMLQTALALSRNAGGHGDDPSVLAAAEAEARHLMGMQGLDRRGGGIDGPAGGAPVGGSGEWRCHLQCISAEAMELTSLRDGDKAPITVCYRM